MTDLSGESVEVCRMCQMPVDMILITAVNYLSLYLVWLIGTATCSDSAEHIVRSILQREEVTNTQGKCPGRKTSPPTAAWERAAETRARVE